MKKFQLGTSLMLWPLLGAWSPLHSQTPIDHVHGEVRVDSNPVTANGSGSK